MDNVVQNININDIIPSNHYQPSIEEKRKIEELAQIIKSLGLLDPILVRPKNGKYEIILGFEKYEAAKIARISKVPVLIKDINDDIFMQYTNIGNHISQSITPQPKDTFSNNHKNTDIINLSVLNKERISKERDEFKMNNEQMNNVMLNNNGILGQPQANEVPTFGGKFFPSLEDEPTNMNMTTGITNQPLNNQTPTNNLIDLTDISVDKETNYPASDFSMPMPNSLSTPGVNPNAVVNNEPVLNESLAPAMASPIPTPDSVINISELKNNTPSVSPTQEAPVSMDILNADFGAPTNIAPATPITTNEFSIPSNIGQSDITPIPQAPNQAMPVIDIQANNIPNINQAPMVPTNIEIPQDLNQIVEPAPSTYSVENTITNAKDITPVLSTIKAVSSNLELFGYKINITEEDLSNMAKITIEVEK